MIERGDDGGGGESLVHRVFAVLAAFRDAPVLGTSDLARRTGLPRTTVHRIAAQLTAQSALMRVGARYRPGPTLFELGSLHCPARLRDAVDPYLVDLQRATGGEMARTLTRAGQTADIDYLARALPSP